LDARMRLQALVVHDIRNPLTALLRAVETDRPATIRQMSERIRAIVESAGELVGGSAISLSEVVVQDLWTCLNGIFAPRLAEKEQSLTMTGDPHLVVVTDLPILCNSVLCNLLNNAMKFAPRGGAIQMNVEPVGHRVRIAVYNPGPGFPEEVLARGPRGDGYRSQPGTDGETGSGYGLRIAALCAERLGGVLEVHNPPQGGAAAAVLLPTRHCTGLERHTAEETEIAGDTQ
jgi:signal transduction histidine kinase